ncbi:MAG: PTS sugar transporter subunit IIA [Longimicrobiaceae bacterium]
MHVFKLRRWFKFGVVHDPMYRPAILSSSVSPDGIEFPDTTRSAHFIFLLLSPAPQREQHLRLLGQISRMVHDNERLREVLQSRNVESVLEGFRTDSTRVERV